MTRLRQSLRNSAKRGLLLNIAIACFSIITGGCSLSTNPTYIKEDIDKTIQNICKEEYKTDVKTKLIGRTLWIYVPLEDLLVKSDKPEKYLERFAIEENKSELKEQAFALEYLIKKIPEEEKTQEYKYNKAVSEKISNVWKVLRRVMFSIDQQDEKNGPQFFYLITADIKNGFEIKELSYYPDLKKVSYDFISSTEYQHRSAQDFNVDPRIILDTEGSHLDYRDITLEEFIALQIKHRIKLKFQKPEVDNNADIDKEVLKVAVYTIKIYGFRDFSGLELNNLFTDSKITLNQTAVWASAIE